MKMLVNLLLAVGSALLLGFFLGDILGKIYFNNKMQSPAMTASVFETMAIGILLTLSVLLVWRFRKELYRTLLKVDDKVRNGTRKVLSSIYSSTKNNTARLGRFIAEIVRVVSVWLWNKTVIVLKATILATRLTFSIFRSAISVLWGKRGAFTKILRAGFKAIMRIWATTFKSAKRFVWKPAVKTGKSHISIKSIDVFVASLAALVVWMFYSAWVKASGFFREQFDLSLWKVLVGVLVLVMVLWITARIIRRRRGQQTQVPIQTATQPRPATATQPTDQTRTCYDRFKDVVTVGFKFAAVAAVVLLAAFIWQKYQYSQAPVAPAMVAKYVGARQNYHFGPREVSEEVALKAICQAESGCRQLGDDGKPYKNQEGSSAFGKYQFLESHRELAHNLGFDLDTEDGQDGYARHLYRESGTQHWEADPRSVAKWGPVLAGLSKGEADMSVRLVVLTPQEQSTYYEIPEHYGFNIKTKSAFQIENERGQKAIYDPERHLSFEKFEANAIRILSLSKEKSEFELTIKPL